MSPTRTDLIAALGLIQNHPACVNQDILSITGCGMSDDEVREHIEANLRWIAKFNFENANEAPRARRTRIRPARSVRHPHRKEPWKMAHTLPTAAALNQPAGLPTAVAAPSSFRIVNTKFAPMGPFGIRYVHDAARPFAVLFRRMDRETCALRCPTQSAAEAAIVKFTAARARYASRAV